MPLKSQKSYNKEFYPNHFLNRLGFFIRLNKIKKALLSETSLKLYRHVGFTDIKYDEVNEVGVKGTFFKSIYFKTNSKKYYFRWLHKNQAKTLLEIFFHKEKLAWRNKYKTYETEIIYLLEWLKEIDERIFFQRASVFSRNVEKAEKLLKEFNPRIPKLMNSTVESSNINKIRAFVNNKEIDRNDINQQYNSIEIVRQTELFDKIEKNPLTNEQRRSVIIDEDANLVIAAAGSGKTSVIVAKTAWLIAKELRKPQDLLLLAFARDAKIEMSDRLTERIKHPDAKDISVHTFHSLGLEIIGHTTDEKPSLSKLAEDDSELLNFIRSTIHEKLQNNHYKNIISRWFSGYFAPYSSQFDFDNYGQYWEYLNKNNIRSLKGEKLKSFEECEIANFLYLKGIDYVYEADYKYRTSNKNRRQYKPDFYLPDFDIYIEHLGLREFGRTAPYVNRKEYLQSLRWKRGLHKLHSTTLIETYSCEKVQGELLERLYEKLLKSGVQFNEIEGDKIFEILNERGQIDPFTSLIKIFLGHFKGSLLREELIRRIGASIDGAERNAAFVDVFIPIFDEYQNYLQKEKAIDFHDMISLATDMISKKEYKSPFRYILVDEFQDISSGRAKLISALQKYDPDVQLFCVGDDWQAIYRFAGSDINFMKDFSKNFGIFERSDLSTTFRCEDKITKEATDFILKNDFQISKVVNSTNIIEQPSIYICFKESNEEVLLQSILDLIVKSEELEKNIDVLVLGRYRLETYLNVFKINYGHILKRLNRSFDKLNIKFKTVHRSKGLEADYVIILDVISNILGFPNEKADDHVLNMVLSEPEAYPNSEERRLFYVALTRAKKKVFINTQSGMISPFVSEIIKSPHEFTLLGKNPDDEPNCSLCVQGKLQLKLGSHGSFWGCSNYPYCKSRSQSCPHCGKGYPIKTDGGDVVCKVCEQSVEPCPMKDCNGWLKQRSGNYGPFWGCTEYSSDTKVCEFTKNINPSETFKKTSDKPIKPTVLEVDYKSKQSNIIKTNNQSTTPANKKISSYHLRLQKIKEEHPNAYQPWANLEDTQLTELFFSGEKIADISKLLGRQPSAISSRLRKLEVNSK